MKIINSHAEGSYPSQTAGFKLIGCVNFAKFSLFQHAKKLEDCKIF
jgi:hypothetical protein